MRQFQFKQLKRSKYNSKKVVVDGIKFDSAKEARVYQQLKLCEKAGVIKNLRLQVPYDLVIPCKYVADFVYVDFASGKEIVADAKGFKTTEYKRKKKYMKLQHCIDILEV